MLDQILTEHPEVEFVQIMIDYFDWKSYLIDSKGCYDVVRKHGKDIVVMEPVKGGVLAQVPEATETWMRATKPELSPAGWALRFAASQPGVIAVLSGMSNREQLHDNVTNMAAYEPLTVGEQAKLIELAAAQKAAGPAGTGDFTRYESEAAVEAALGVAAGSVRRLGPPARLHPLVRAAHRRPAAGAPGGRGDGPFGQPGGVAAMSWGSVVWVGDLRRALEGLGDDSELTVTVVGASGDTAWADGLRLDVDGLPWGGSGLFLDVYVDGTVARLPSATSYDDMPL